jgi:MYXO-CTERM domain-containing protein
MAPIESMLFYHLELRVVSNVRRFVRRSASSNPARRQINNNVEDFLLKRDRIIVVRLDRETGPSVLGPLRKDLWWAWPAAAFGGFLAWRTRRR